MKLVECSRCGSDELIQSDGYVICAYCQSRFLIEADDRPQNETVIDVRSDIRALLKKCKEDPVNRYRYASLILDIDPSNAEAIKFLMKG